ncbi:MAG TPA: alpha/beta hydrolase-fold protein [Marmoricola sp.]|nr:alpha/beta hydrolase-fold protein [Marmoricola sp.]
MLSLTGRPLLVLTIILAVVAILGLVYLVYRATGSSPLTRSRRAAFVSVALVLALSGPAFAVGATALVVNNDYGFYTSWADLTGSGPAQVAIQTGSLVRPGQGTLQVRTVQTHVGGLDDRVIVWLPPGYNPHPLHPYPVVMFLPGQPNSPQGTFRHFQFAQIANQLLQSHRMPPFVGVFPTLMIAPPRDTECTNIPGSVQAETWLNTEVPTYITQQYAVQPVGPDWSLVGWSTGGFCAAKLVTAHPGRFGSAAAFGGYFTPIQDKTTGSLFGGLVQRFDHNSPAWLYRANGGLGASRLLIVAGRQDAETWRASQQMIKMTSHDPAVSRLVFPTGGHNYKNYRSYLSQVLVWGARSWQL